MLAVSIVVGTSLAIASITRLAVFSFRSESARTELDLEARRAMDRVVEELRSAPIDGMGAFPESPAWLAGVTLDRVQDVAEADGAISWETVRVELQPSPWDPDDGIDNDGNGLVDDGILVLVRDPTGTALTITLANMVPEYLDGETANGIDDNGNGLIDERGFCLERSGQLLTVRLSLGRRSADDGEIIMQTQEATLCPRN